MSRTDEDQDFEPYDTGDIGCRPHLLFICGLCGDDVCATCEIHIVDGEEQDECPALMDS